MDSDENVARVAEGQHGAFTYRQARAAGLTAQAIQHRLDARRWEMLDRGVYRLPGTARTWHQQLIALTFAAGPVAAASHRSAAALLALPGFVVRWSR